MIDEQIIKNIHTEVSKVYDYMKGLFDNCKNDIDNCFNEPNICLTIRLLEGETSQYDVIDYFKCQITNKLEAISIILQTLYLPREEPNRKVRDIFCMKYAILTKVNKEKAFDYRKLNKLLMYFPINPEIAKETENFYNNLMEDVI